MERSKLKILILILAFSFSLVAFLIGCAEIRPPRPEDDVRVGRFFWRKPDGTWTKPKNMGPSINSAYKDEYPHVTPDGKYLFFNSNRPSSLNQKPIEDGPGNIYWVDATIIERLK